MTMRVTAPVLLTLMLFASPLAATEPAPPPLNGWVDMHTHPMSHLAFGGKLLHGAPDLGIIMPAIPDGGGCRPYSLPLNRHEASNEDRAIHGGWDLINNNCGDDLRKAFIRGFEGALGARVGHQEDGARGFPIFNSFPAYNDLTHQQMWVDWIHRAYANGLRVMVSLAVNNLTLAAAVMGPGDINGDDAASANIQIQQLKALVARHTWMEIAYDAEDVRRIVGANRLAIILGVEIDNIGNMRVNPAVQPGGDEASRTFITNQLQSLHDQGVRYIFPVHIVDNKLGATAIYENQFNTSNFHQTGRFWDIACAPAGSNVTHRFEVAGFDLIYALFKLKIGIDPFATPPAPPACSGEQFSGGHVNQNGLTPLGRFAIEEMMRLGMLIDIDHMSSASVDGTLSLAEENDYPVNSGHNGPRMPGPQNEVARTDSEYTRIANLGGMVGLGSGDRASNFVSAYQYVRGLVGGSQVAIGTDANGMVKLPGPDPAVTGVYDATFGRLTDGSRTWDIEVDGVANYGLFADYVRSWGKVGMTPAQQAAFQTTAEGFARMWEQVETAAAAMVPTPPVANAGGPYSVNESGSVSLDASGTTDINQTADSLTYEWDFDADGDYDDATGSAPSFAAGDGPATITVSLRVTDEDAMTATASATITVQNVAPAATLVQLPPAMVFEGLSASFQFTGATDVSSADVAAGFEFALDCTDDGVDDVPWSSSTTATCTYADAGTFTVRGHVRDKDGGVSDATTSVHVLTTAEAFDAIAAMITALRTGGSLNNGQANALLVKLAHARDLLNAGNESGALHHLNVLLGQVQTFGTEGQLTPAESAELAFWINQLIASVSA